MSGDLRTSSQPSSPEALQRTFAEALGGGGTLDGLEQSFVTQACEDYAEDETPELAGEDVGAVLADAWRWAERRSPGESRVLVQPLSAAPGSRPRDPL